MFIEIKLIKWKNLALLQAIEKHHYYTKNW
jgi:hypothetical protein